MTRRPPRSTRTVTLFPYTTLCRSRSTPLAFIGLAETGVFANYTRLWSDRDDPATGESIAIDYQPTYVYNVGLTQNIPSWKASFGFSYQKQGESRFVTYGEIESQLYDGNLEVFIEKRLSKNVEIGRGSGRERVCQ